MAVQSSTEFVWELGQHEQDSRLSHGRLQVRRALERELAPIRLAFLLMAGFIYVAPHIFLQDSLLEAYAGMSEVRAKMGVAILLGISTLVVLPIFGYLVHLSAESKALVEAARRHVGTVVPSSKPGHVQIRIATLDGADEVLVKTRSTAPLGTPLVVYAIPEEGNLAAVEFERPGEPRIRIGHLRR